jgi:hypothetical protein
MAKAAAIFVLKGSIYASWSKGESRDHGIMRRWRNLRDGFFNPKNRNTLPSEKLKSGDKLNQFFR